MLVLFIYVKMTLEDDIQQSDQQLAADPSDLLKDSNSNTPKTAESTPPKDIQTSTPTPSTPTLQSPSTTPRGGKPSPPPKPNTTPKTPRRTPPPRQDSLHTSPTPELAVKGSPRPIPRRKPKPETRTIAIQTDNSHTPSTSTDSPQIQGSPARVFPTQASITIPEQAVLRQSTPHTRVSRAVSIAVDSPTTHLAGTSQEKPTKIRWDLSPSPRNRASLRREKSIKQRREEERLIKQSRVLGSSYELSPDLQQKQVEMLEKRYGGRAKAQKAALVIQQAYRKHELQKEFQRLRRTRSDSRISSYLKNYSAKVHSKYSNRARVMVIEDADSSTPVIKDTKGTMRKLEKSIDEGAEELASITRELESQAKQAINESSISPVVRSTPTEQHRNNSNNVFPKGIVTPKDKGSSGEVDEVKEGSGKKVVVTLTMTRHNSSTELQERSTPPRSEKTIITQKDVIRVQSQEVWKSPPTKGSSSPPPPISPGSSPPSGGRAVTKIITTNSTSEKQVARKICIPDISGSPPVAQNISPGAGVHVPSPVVVRASEMPSSTHCGFVLTGIKDNSIGNGSESPKISRPIKTVSVGNDVMSPVIDRKIVKKESPMVQSPPMGVLRESRKSLDQAAEKSHVSPSTEHVEVGQDSSYSRHPTRTDSNVVTQEVGDRKQRVGIEQSIETNSLRASHTPVSMRQESSTDKKRESVSSSGSTCTEGDVNMEYILGGRRLTNIRADDSVSTTSTVSGESFEVINVEHSSSSDVPSVVVATPEGSLMDFIHSTDSEGSDTEGEFRSRSHSGSLGKNQNVAITAKRRMAKANSTGQMNSPVWKRKNQDTRIGTRNGTLMNGSATPVRMTRSDTGDSMSSESSGSSKYTFPDDSSISESNDTLPGEIEELCEKRPLVPSLSIPMTPSRRRRYRVGINLFNKKPEKGIKFLIENRFIENSPHEVAKFLLKRTGFSKQKIGEYLGNLQKEFNQMVLECFVEAMEFKGLTIDEALRKFQMSFLLPGEAQKIERLMEAFSKRYCYCNAEFANSFHNLDTIFILSFAIIMLTTDLHNPNVKPERKMRMSDFIKNLSGIDNEHDLDPELLTGIYERIKKKAFQPGEDHVTAVRKLEANIMGEKPFPLAEPHRRLVSSCSLLEVNDPTKKDKKHIREVFLLNDMILITKLYKKKTGAILGYKKKVLLQGATVLEFSSQHYPYGIRLVSRQDKTLASFCASHPDDRTKFVGDIRECILEIEEMESLRIEAELERQKMIRKSQASTSDSGVGLDTESLASTQNLSGSMDSLAPPLKDGSLKRTTLSNSLMDLKEAANKSDHRSSVSSLDSGVPIDINATMPLPKKSRSPLPSSMWGRKKQVPTNRGPPGITPSPHAESNA
ncbi:IQ motif and SEC7 domain-containing protein 1-like isoform X1 [Lytechinus pictus]|uniref:IQ motif and SEC7 domain-containing protein 1-like isoform X1 n=2 Tax=Lytechinus pictus TaxID=7653 RepID=UPI0030B9EAE6